MQNNFPINIKIKTKLYSKIGNLNTDISNAFKELIDNSTTSFEDHREKLKQIGEDKCRVIINWDDEKLVVKDNAYGMNKNDFIRAFGLGEEAEEYSEISRGQFGMGLKYSALSIGDTFTIETAEFGSGIQYKASLDSKDLAKTNGEVINGESYNCDIKKHGTVITISSLKEEQKFSKFNIKKKKLDELSKLIEKLSRTYSTDLKMGKLEISINSIPVQYIPPVYMKNKESGNEEIVSFDDSFIYDGNTYKFAGFVAWLNQGDTYNAGISLIQKDRALQVSYRPEYLFGDAKTYRSQRIYGEIKLLGDNWKLTFTKNAVNWDKQLEQKFLEAIECCAGVKDLFNRAEKYRVKNENPKIEEIKKWDLEKIFENLKQKQEHNKISNTLVHNQVDNENLDNNNKVEQNGINYTDSKNEDSSINEVVYEIPVFDSNYKLHIIPEDIGDMKSKLFKKVKIAEDEYKVYVNLKAPYFKEFTSKDSSKLILKTVVLMVISELEAMKNIPDAIGVNMFETKLNDLSSIDTSKKEK